MEMLDVYCHNHTKLISACWGGKRMYWYDEGSGTYSYRCILKELT